MKVNILDDTPFSNPLLFESTVKLSLQKSNKRPNVFREINGTQKSETKAVFSPSSKDSTKKQANGPLFSADDKLIYGSWTGLQAFRTLLGAVLPSSSQVQWSFVVSSLGSIFGVVAGGADGVSTNFGREVALGNRADFKKALELALKAAGELDRAEGTEQYAKKAELFAQQLCKVKMYVGNVDLVQVTKTIGTLRDLYLQNLSGTLTTLPSVGLGFEQATNAGKAVLNAIAAFGETNSALGIVQGTLSVMQSVSEFRSANMDGKLLSAQKKRLGNASSFANTIEEKNVRRVMQKMCVHANRARKDRRTNVDLAKIGAGFRMFGGLNSIAFNATALTLAIMGSTNPVGWVAMVGGFIYLGSVVTRMLILDEKKKVIVKNDALNQYRYTMDPKVDSPLACLDQLIEMLQNSRPNVGSPDKSKASVQAREFCAKLGMPEKIIALVAQLPKEQARDLMAFFVYGEGAHLPSLTQQSIDALSSTKSGLCTQKAAAEYLLRLNAGASSSDKKKQSVKDDILNLFCKPGGDMKASERLSQHFAGAESELTVNDAENPTISSGKSQSEMLNARVEAETLYSSEISLFRHLNDDEEFRMQLRALDRKNKQAWPKELKKWLAEFCDRVLNLDDRKKIACTLLFYRRLTVRPLRETIYSIANLHQVKGLPSKESALWGIESDIQSLRKDKSLRKDDTHWLVTSSLLRQQLNKIEPKENVDVENIIELCKHISEKYPRRPAINSLSFIVSDLLSAKSKGDQRAAIDLLNAFTTRLGTFEQQKDKGGDERDKFYAGCMALGFKSQTAKKNYPAAFTRIKALMLNSPDDEPDYTLNGTLHFISDAASKRYRQWFLLAQKEIRGKALESSREALEDSEKKGEFIDKIVDELMLGGHAPDSDAQRALTENLQKNYSNNNINNKAIEWKKVIGLASDVLKRSGDADRRNDIDSVKSFLNYCLTDDDDGTPFSNNMWEKLKVTQAHKSQAESLLKRRCSGVVGENTPPLGQDGRDFYYQVANLYNTCVGNAEELTAAKLGDLLSASRGTPKRIVGEFLCAKLGLKAESINKYDSRHIRTLLFMKLSENILTTVLNEEGAKRNVRVNSSLDGNQFLGLPDRMALISHADDSWQRLEAVLKDLPFGMVFARDNYVTYLNGVVEQINDHRREFADKLSPFGIVFDHDGAMRYANSSVEVDRNVNKFLSRLVSSYNEYRGRISEHRERINEYRRGIHGAKQEMIIEEVSIDEVSIEEVRVEEVEIIGRKREFDKLFFESADRGEREKYLDKVVREIRNDKNEFHGKLSFLGIDFDEQGRMVRVQSSTNLGKEGKEFAFELIEYFNKKINDEIMIAQTATLRSEIFGNAVLEEEEEKKAASHEGFVQVLADRVVRPKEGGRQAAILHKLKDYGVYCDVQGNIRFKKEPGASESMSEVGQSFVKNVEAKKEEISKAALTDIHRQQLGWLKGINFEEGTFQAISGRTADNIVAAIEEARKSASNPEEHRALYYNVVTYARRLIQKKVSDSFFKTTSNSYRVLQCLKVVQTKLRVANGT